MSLFPYLPLGCRAFKFNTFLDYGNKATIKKDKTVYNCVCCSVRQDYCPIITYIVCKFIAIAF